MWTIDPHPLLDAAILTASWPAPLGELRADWMRELVLPHGITPFDDDPEVLQGAHKSAVRDLLRHGGFKPAGRNKPCWEYLVGVVAKGKFPWINPAVDATNLAALHGALPVSTVDADKLRGALRIGVAEPGSSIPFNASEQTIDVSGLLCLFDAEGPCADSVKDSQRTKTDPGTRRTVTVVWGTTALPGRTGRVAAWQRELFERAGATVEQVYPGG